MAENKERRTYQETYFWMFIICIIITLISEFTGISVKEMTEQADGLIRRIIDSMNILIIWIVPTFILIKKVVEGWIKAVTKRDIEIAKIQNQSPEKKDE